MKTLSITLSFLLFSTCNILKAQNIKVVTEGIIEYKKTVNMHAMYEKFGTIDQQQMERIKTNIPKLKAFDSSLSFSGDKSLFTPGANSIQSAAVQPQIAQNNIVYTDLSTRISTTQRDTPYGLFLVKDSVRAINWKITDETRDILGYPCRRANALIMDSIYVVAFFTSDIPVSGGPESFTGLPGMILLVSMPHENMTWEATKVSVTPVSTLKIPSKGKLKTNKQYHEAIESSELNMRDRPQSRQMFLRGFYL